MSLIQSMRRSSLTRIFGGTVLPLSGLLAEEVRQVGGISSAMCVGIFRFLSCNTTRQHFWRGSLGRTGF